MFEDIIHWFLSVFVGGKASGLQAVSNPVLTLQPNPDKFAE